MPLPVTPVQTRAGGSTEPRVALLVVAAVRGGLWSVLTTHLDPSDEKARLQEVGRVNELIHEQTAVGVPLIVGGDFNSTPESAAQAELRAAGLRDAWTECGQGDGFTYPADAPAKRIDYLFLTGDVHCSAAEVVDSRISDHRPLLITIR